jgi:hypothetical protein
MKTSAEGGALLIAIAGGSPTTTTAATNSVIPASINPGSVGGGFAVKVDLGVIRVVVSVVHERTIAKLIAKLCRLAFSAAIDSLAQVFRTGAAPTATG